MKHNFTRRVDSVHSANIAHLITLDEEQNYKIDDVLHCIIGKYTLFTYCMNLFFSFDYSNYSDQMCKLSKNFLFHNTEDFHALT